MYIIACVVLELNNNLVVDNHYTQKNAYMLEYGDRKTNSAKKKCI